MSNLKYLSPEWRDEAEKRLKAELTPEDLKKATVTTCSTYTDCPDGKQKYLYFKVDNGEFTSIEVGEGDPPKAEFGITGTYDTYVKIEKGEIKTTTALMTRKVKLVGNMAKAMKLTGNSNKINRVLATIPTDY